MRVKLLKKRLKVLNCFLLLIFLRSDDALAFSDRSSGPLVVPLGGSVLLPCFVDKPLALERVKVEWSRTDSETVVHLYHEGDVRPVVQHQDYHDRAHLFTDNFKHGNFSLLLTNVKKEDKGVYRCKVYSEQGAEKTLVEIKDVEFLIVPESDQSLSVYVGEDVTLNCSVDSHIPAEDIEEVSWKKRVNDEHITVLLFQNNKTLLDASDEQYRDRVEFFTDEIHRGNFSLRLKRVRTEDKGLYTCQVFAGRLSDNTTVILKQLGFTTSQKAVLILCISACGSALLFCSLIYCRSYKPYTSLCLHLCLHFCPNIFLLMASIVWGVTEASLYGTISCCAVYILRLFWITPYHKDFPDKMMKYVQSSHADLYFPAVMIAMYLVLLTEHFKDINAVTWAILGVLFVLMCLLWVLQLLSNSCELSGGIYDAIEKAVAICSFYLLPSIQLGLLMYPHVGLQAAFCTALLPLLCCVSLCWWLCDAGMERHCRFFLDKSVWVLMCVMSMIMVNVYNAVLRKKYDDVELVCISGFLQALWMLSFFEVPDSYQKIWETNILFLFGTVILVLVNSVALMTDVILKAVNGEHPMEDLRIGVLPSECFFTIPMLFLPIITPWTPLKMKFLRRSRSSMLSDGTCELLRNS